MTVKRESTVTRVGYWTITENINTFSGPELGKISALKWARQGHRRVHACGRKSELSYRVFEGEGVQKRAEELGSDHHPQTEQTCEVSTASFQALAAAQELELMTTYSDFEGL